MEENNFKGIGFEPNQKELDVFNKEKMDMYKGTFFVCLVYGLSAFGLLIAIFFTDLGREYIYKRMMPAAITFIVGALFIIFYLIINIYDLKPRKISNKMEKDNAIICPDYWKLKLTNQEEKSNLVANNTISDNNNSKLYNDIRNDKSEHLKYKCVMDETVFSNLKSVSDSKNTIYEGKTSYYQKATTSMNKADTTKPDYLYVVKKDTSSADTTAANGTYTDTNLSTYAEFSGMYRVGEKNGDTWKVNPSDGTTGMQNNALVPVEAGSRNATFYNAKNPLICNVVYPQVLAKLDAETPEQNKYRCLYAKACDIPWTGIGCEPSKPGTTT
jgi:hypothetical protein